MASESMILADSIGLKTAQPDKIKTIAYLLAQTVVTPLYGKLGDMYGRKIVLQAALLIFLVGSALCGLSRNLDELIAFRAVQGLQIVAW